MNYAPPQGQTVGFGSQHIRTDRDNEYRIFSDITRGLQKALDSGDRQIMIEATYRNNKLWYGLAADLENPGNSLPTQIKAGLASLAIFSVKHGKRVLSENISPTPLIEINLHIMKGLRGKVSE